MPPTTAMPNPTRIVIDNRPSWQFADGTVLPVISGGADDGGDAGGGGDDGGTDDGDDGGTDDLGDAGKRALATERARARDEAKARKASDRKAADLQKQLDDIKAAGQSDGDKAIDAARKEADETARKDERARANRRILASEVKAAAGTKLADPNDAIRLLDLDDFEVSDDGDVDEKQIAKAIDQLLKDKPYLAAKATRTGGGFDNGARSNSGSGPDMNTLLRQAAGKQ